ncbi:MAG: hypothetical protein IK118_00530 [Clostridia bacterium]|nr:hypothetical protein [Clostridia bacterium]
MKKAAAAVCAVLLLLLCGCDLGGYVGLKDTDAGSEAAGASDTEAEETTDEIPDFSLRDITSADRITVGSVATGKTAEITDDDDIEYITGFCGDVSAESGRSSRGYYGGLYSIGFFSGAETLCLIEFLPDYEFIYSDGQHYEKAGGFEYPYMYEMTYPERSAFRDMIQFIAGRLGEEEYPFPPDTIALGDYDLSGVTEIRAAERGSGRPGLVSEISGDVIERLTGCISGISGEWVRYSPEMAGTDFEIHLMKDSGIVMILGVRFVNDEAFFVVTLAAGFSGIYKADAGSEDLLKEIAEICSEICLKE